MKVLASVLRCWVAMVLLGASVAAQDAAPAGPSLLKATFGKLPLYFVENRGLYPDEVAYYIQGADKTLFFTKDGITFRLKGRDRAWVVKLEFVGANPDVVPRGEDRQQAVFSYFRGPEKDWKTGLKTYSKIVYRDLWPGIDLVYRAGVGALKYEFKVAPGADPAKIRLRYRGVTSLTVDDSGALKVETPEGSFGDAPPVAYQETEGGRVEVRTAFVLDEAGTQAEPGFGFEVGRYDATRTLVLDPAFLLYCGYIGGGGDDWAQGIAVDAAGNAYIAGTAMSSEQTFPVFVGPDLTHNGGGPFDAFVAKVDSTGKRLVYCGYIGGNAPDMGQGIAVDGAGNAYVTGWTSSTEQTFPVTVGPDLTHNGFQDAFVAKVNAQGTALDYCGYIGGIANDHGNGIAVDGTGNAYVTGWTMSSEQTFPVTVGPDLTYNGNGDAFVAKVNAQGTALVYCGYIGGTDPDCGNGIAVDDLDAAYVTGEAISTEQSFPVTVGPDLTQNGANDAFVAKVNKQGSALVYCGYIGGVLLDWGNGVAVDAARNAYVTGRTSSTEQSFPVTVGPDLTQNGANDAFVAKVNAQGTALVYCGYVGGSSNECGNGIAVDAAGNAHVTGDTDSTEQSFPVTVGPDLTYNGGTWNISGGDAFVAKVNAPGTAFVYCGYIGGGFNDAGEGIALDAAGNAYVTGWTYSDERTFPVTVGPDLTFNAVLQPIRQQNAFVAKVSLTLLRGSGMPRPGCTVSLALEAINDAARPYRLASSLGMGPIPIGNRQIGLSADGLFVVTVGDLWPWFFSGYRGVLDAKGEGQAAIHIPNIPALIGISIHTAFVTLDAWAPSGIRSISDTFSFPITK